MIIKQYDKRLLEYSNLIDLEIKIKISDGRIQQ